VDSAALDAMATIVVYAWTADADVCVVNSSSNVAAVSGDDNLVDDTTCSYVSWFGYENGEDSTGTEIVAST
jgi:hypothetical protein